MEFTREPLDEQAALRLLSRVRVGRLVYTVQALPAVLPARFRLDRGGSLVLWASALGELWPALNGAVVAFEAGEISEVDGSGWSVTVIGRAQIVVPPEPDGSPGGPPGVLLLGPGKAGIPADTAEGVSARVWPELVSCRTLDAVTAAACAE